LAAREFAPDPTYVTALPDLMAGLRGLLLKEGKTEGKGREEDERRMETGDGRGGRGR